MRYIELGKCWDVFVSHSPPFSRPGAVQNTRTLPHSQNDPHIANPSQQVKVSCLNSVCACFSHSAFVTHREASKGTSHHPLETRRCCQKRRSTNTRKSCSLWHDETPTGSKAMTCKAWGAHCCYVGGALVLKKLPRVESQNSMYIDHIESGSRFVWTPLLKNSFVVSWSQCRKGQHHANTWILD